MNFDNYTLRLLQHDDLQLYFAMVDRNRKRLENFFTGTVFRTATLADTKIFIEEILAKAKDEFIFLIY